MTAQSTDSPTLVPVPVGPAGTRIRKSLVIGIDGSMMKFIKSSATPNLQRLMAEGLASEWLLPYDGSEGKAYTDSGPGWSNIATGVWPAKHGVMDNGFGGKDFGTYPDFLTRLKQADPDISTFAVANWPPILTSRSNGPIYSDLVDVKLDGGENCDAAEDEMCIRAAVRYLREQNPDSAFVYFGHIDEVSHRVGPESPLTTAALAEVDRMIGELLDALRARPTYADEDWLLLITTDHGHKPGGNHGGATLEERSAYVIASGSDIPAGTVRDDVRHVDIAPSVLAHAGVKIDPAWELDGRPVQELLGA